MSDPADDIEAIRRIGNSADGYMLRRHLQRVINSVSPWSADSGALHRHEGRRTFALELRALLDEAAANAGPTSDRPGKSDPDEPFTVARGKSVALARGGTRRRVESYAESTDKA